MEEREHRNTGTFEGNMAETSSSTTVSTKLERIAKLARTMPQAALTTLAHHIDIDWLREAYRRTRKDGATGIDRQTADEYARNLDENLRSLLERAKSGSYVAPPVRRVHIPKGDVILILRLGPLVMLRFGPPLFAALFSFPCER